VAVGTTLCVTDADGLEVAIHHVFAMASRALPLLEGVLRGDSQNKRIQTPSLSLPEPPAQLARHEPATQGAARTAGRHGGRRRHGRVRRRAGPCVEAAPGLAPHRDPEGRGVREPSKNKRALRATPNAT